MSFLTDLRERAAAASAAIGFPEAAEPRTVQAIQRLAEEGAVRPVIVESAAELDRGLASSHVEVLDPYAPGRRGEVAKLGGDVSGFVPPPVLRELTRVYGPAVSGG